MNQQHPPGRAPRMRRRDLPTLALTALAVAGLGTGGSAAAQAVPAARGQLPLSTSLPDELARAARQGQPLVVMVSLHPCPWCDEVRGNYLAPMHAREGLAVVQVDMRSQQMTRNLQGQPSTHDALVRAWDVKAAPTLLFLGPCGKEVADRLVGGSPDFYSAYLDGRLERARKAMGTP